VVTIKFVLVLILSCLALQCLISYSIKLTEKKYCGAFFSLGLFLLPATIIWQLTEGNGGFLGTIRLVGEWIIIIAPICLVGIFIVNMFLIDFPDK